MTGYVLDWLNLVFRWAHVIAGVAWIGASFYFVWLSDVLTPPADPADRRRGIAGELWTLQDGTLVANRTYPAGPRGAPPVENVRWLRGEAYATWGTGLALLALIYWLGASTFLVDPAVRRLSPPAAVAIAFGMLLAGWAGYELLCRMLRERAAAMWCAIAAWLVLVDWTLFHLFAGRAATIHLGAVLGTIMVANVAHVVVPAHRRIAAQLAAGRAIDARLARTAKMRALHNTYFALPVLFLMIGNHYPQVYGSPNAWLAVALICAAGVLARHFVRLGHGGRYVVILPAAAALALALAALVASPHGPRRGPPGGATVPLSGSRACHSVAPTIAERCDSAVLGSRLARAN